MKKLFPIIIGLSLVLGACSSTPNSMDHDQLSSSSGGDSTAMERLKDSPRHAEWIEIDNNGKKIYTWIVYPERKEKAPVVILIHENRGLNDWARSMADQVAEAGYIAIAPDLLSSFSEENTRTSDFSDEDAARTAIGQLKQENVMSDLNAVALWAKMIPSSDGKLVSAGFCWGGSQSFQFAAESSDLDVAMVFYGTGPVDSEVYSKISVPVFGFYGGADERVNATIETSKQLMTDAGKTYDYEIYDGAGHAFMRTGEDQEGDPANIAARRAAFERMKAVLSKL